MTPPCTTCPPGTHREFDFPSRPFDVVTIGWGGWTGYHRCLPHGSTSHYGHTFVDRIDEHTLVIDKTTMDDADLVPFAVRGPMLAPWLPEGTINTCSGPSRVLGEHFAQYGLDASGLDYAATDIYARMAVERGASVCLGADFICDREPWKPGDVVCADCTRHRQQLAAAA